MSSKTAIFVVIGMPTLNGNDYTYDFNFNYHAEDDFIRAITINFVIIIVIPII